MMFPIRVPCPRAQAMQQHAARNPGRRNTRRNPCHTSRLVRDETTPHLRFGWCASLAFGLSDPRGAWQVSADQKEKLNQTVKDMSRTVPSYIWLSVFPQLVPSSSSSSAFPHPAFSIHAIEHRGVFHCFTDGCPLKTTRD